MSRKLEELKIDLTTGPGWAGDMCEVRVMATTNNGGTREVHQLTRLEDPDMLQSQFDYLWEKLRREFKTALQEL